MDKKLLVFVAHFVRAQRSASCVHRLTIHRTPRHIYAQVISHPMAPRSWPCVDRDKAVADIGGTAVIDAAGRGGLVCRRACQGKGCRTCCIRSLGFRYHGRVKALADAAREAGLSFKRMFRWQITKPNRAGDDLIEKLIGVNRVAKVVRVAVCSVLPRWCRR